MVTKNGHTPIAESELTLDLTPWLPSSLRVRVKCGEKTYELKGDYSPSFFWDCQVCLDSIREKVPGADEEAYLLAAKALDLPLQQVRAELAGGSVLHLLSFLVTGRGRILSTESLPTPSSSADTTESAPTTSSAPDA